MTSLIDLPLAELTARAAAVRDAAFGTRVTYSPKVFIPLTRLCRDRCGYCTFATAPRPDSAPYLSPDEVLVDRPAGRGRRLPRGAVHPRRGARGALPRRRGNGSPSTATATTVDYLVAMAARVLDETGLLPHANAGALASGRAGPAARRGAVTGDDGRDPRADLRRPPGRARQAARASRLATLEAAGELAHPLHDGDPGRHRRDGARPGRGAARPSPLSHRRHGHVQEVIVQNFLPKAGTAMRDRRPCPPDDHLRAIALARLILPPDVHVQAPPNLSEPDDCRPPAGRRHRRLGRRLAGHPRPRQPRAALAAPRRPARGHRGRRAHAAPRGSPSTPSTPAGAEHLARPGACTSRSWTGPTPRAWPATTPARSARAGRAAAATSATAPRSSRSGAAPPAGTPAPTSTPPALRPAARRRARRRGRRGPRRRAEPAQQLGEDEIVTLFSAPAAPRSPPWPRWPTSCGAEAVGRHRHLRRQPQHQLHQRLHLQVPFCGFSKGPLSLNLRGTPYLLTLDDIAGRVPRGVGPGRHRGLPAGRHPPQLRRRLLHRRRPGREGGRARTSTSTASPPSRSPRAPSASASRWPTTCRRLKEAGLRTLPGTAAEILDDEVRADPLPRQDRHRGVARGAPHRPRGRAALATSRSCSARSSSPAHWARHLLRTRRPAGRDRRVHRVRAAAVRAHGRADLPQAPGPARPDLPRDAC